ncbi:hypothetical protein AX16_000842 [Volvariella volvacea WC 439]|nr:hypothetical protein AX16_000842 [Volvariella volvacea WC 439]
MTARKIANSNKGELFSSLIQRLTPTLRRRKGMGYRPWVFCPNGRPRAAQAIRYPGYRTCRISSHDCNGDSEHFKDVNIPDIPENEIAKYYRKRDIPLVALTLLQTVWFITQCIARRAHGLAIAPIEAMALAYMTANMITYLAWWKKPFSVAGPIYFDVQGIRIDIPEEAKSQEMWYQTLRDKVSECTARGVAVSIGLAVSLAVYFLFNPLQEPRKTSVSSFHPVTSGPGEVHFILFLCAGPIYAIFGGVQLLVWNEDMRDQISLYLAAIRYLVARIMLVHLLIPSNIPESVYEVVGWTKFIPHI